MIETNRPFSPDWTSPPGDTISDILEERGWTQVELADRLGYTPKHVSQLINGKATITDDTAVRLERVLGSSASFWLTREAQYRAKRAELDERKRLEGWSSWCSSLPLKELMSADAIAKRPLNSANMVSTCADLLQFFRVASPTEWTRRYAAMETDYRRASSEKADVGALSAWLRLGEIQAESQDSPPYDRARFEQKLREIRNLFVHKPTGLEREIRSLCSDAGVALAVVPEIAHAQVKCAARWLNPHRPLIQVSDDQVVTGDFRYAFFHEAAHILLHDKKAVFLDNFAHKSASSDEESQADQWANHFLAQAVR